MCPKRIWEMVQESAPKVAYLPICVSSCVTEPAPQVLSALLTYSLTKEAPQVQQVAPNSELHPKKSNALIDVPILGICLVSFSSGI